MISLRLSDRGRRINVCHIATNGAIGFGWTKGQLEDLDLPTGLADEFYARVAARYGLKLKANGCPAGLSLVLISDNEDDFLRLVIEFATRVREAAGLSVSSAPAATETSDDEADEAETDDESDSLA